MGAFPANINNQKWSPWSLDSHEAPLPCTCTLLKTHTESPYLDCSWKIPWDLRARWILSCSEKLCSLIICLPQFVCCYSDGLSMASPFPPLCILDEGGGWDLQPEVRGRTASDTSSRGRWAYGGVWLPWDRSKVILGWNIGDHSPRPSFPSAFLTRTQFLWRIFGPSSTARQWLYPGACTQNNKQMCISAILCMLTQN